MNKTTLLLIVSTTIIFFFGLLMVFNTTSAEVLSRSLEVSTHFALVKQLTFGLIAIAIGFIVWFLGYNKIIQSSPYLLIGCIILLSLVFVPKIGQTINGAKRWIGFSGLGLQPSEIAKFVLPMFFIGEVTKSKKHLDFNAFLKIILICLVPIFLILIEPDTGTTVIILTTLAAAFFLTKIRFMYWAAPLLIIICLAAFVAYNMNHVRNRITVYLHPEKDLKGKGHQPYQAKIAVGSGKVFGRGLGESLQKFDYLPEARSDYIAAIYAEEVGFLGIAILIFLYMCVTYSGFAVAMKSKDKRGFYLACILTFLISFQAFLNLGVVSGLLPSKGVTLPFFSQGGTSLMVNIIAIFLLLSITKEKKVKKCTKKRSKL
ncbi:MAG: Lipid II flippase FtsW [Candidatus Anoxychlamydiales bacterium]|nr:Lipid II flippase FtsW [Candidatus Anoxychlamydiales bacterium]